MGKWLVLNRNKKVPDHFSVRTEDRGGTKLLVKSPPELICQEGPHSSHILFPVSGVDGDKRLRAMLKNIEETAAFSNSAT